jgi:hypothetical protein
MPIFGSRKDYVRVLMGKIVSTDVWKKIRAPDSVKVELQLPEENIITRYVATMSQCSDAFIEFHYPEYRRLVLSGNQDWHWT